jgi:hypothetical protein
MIFPMQDQMTEEQSAMNRAAEADLIRGKHYRFEPSVTATAVPTGGQNTCALEECTFDRGWYIGLVRGNHVFQGKPMNDQRLIPIPKGYENAPDLDELLDKLRESYFHVLFIGGSVAILDEEES